MKTCKTCKYWNKGVCDGVDRIFRPEVLFEIEADASDDTGLHWKLLTGPEFGCVHHKEINDG